MKEGHQGSRMHVRLDKEKEEEKLIASKITDIEKKMKDRQQRKKLELRQKSEGLRFKNEIQQ